jgi:lipoic acid synthetase
MNRYPDWILESIKKNKKELNNVGTAVETKKELNDYFTNTICYEALCPNKGECFKAKHATFLILGTRCTRNCRFCAVDKSKPLPPDPDEPQRIAELAKKWNIKYLVFTSPTRDDLSDGGAYHFAKTIEAVRGSSNGPMTEPLIPDFKGDIRALEAVLSAAPSVLSHNIETVPRLYKDIRSMASYERSLNILRSSKKINAEIPTKSSIIIGMGETLDEIKETINDLKENLCDIVVIGQYLAPSDKHYPVKKLYTPEEFDTLKCYALSVGIKSVISEPLARSSYKAYEAYKSVNAGQ